MTAYYNDNDPYCVAWLRNLIAVGHLPAGDVDGRSIKDVRADDLAGYDQCHFFAGLGGWPYALRLAGWPDGHAVWTGSCPCQPFSTAGRRKGFTDDRHLWPDWLRIIRERRPTIVLGEQVASAASWLDRVCLDMEGADYACAATDIPACGVDAPHKRARLWFVARDNQSDVGDSVGARLALGCQSQDQHAAIRQQGASASATGMGSFWSSAEWYTSDEKTRRVEPGIRLLADGVPARVAKLRALGNAIVPQVAAQFIAAVMECIDISAPQLQEAA